MKSCHFVEFYYLRTRDDGTTYWANGVGSDSVLYLDGRLSLFNMRWQGKQVGKARGFDGYRVCRGTHTNPFYITAAVVPVT